MGTVLIRSKCTLLLLCDQAEQGREVARRDRWKEEEREKNNRQWEGKVLLDSAVAVVQREQIVLLGLIYNIRRVITGQMILRFVKKKIAMQGKKSKDTVDAMGHSLLIKGHADSMA